MAGRIWTGRVRGVRIGDASLTVLLLALSGCAIQPPPPQTARPPVHRVASPAPGPWTPEPGPVQDRPRQVSVSENTASVAAEVVAAAPAQVPGSPLRRSRHARPGEAAIAVQVGDDLATAPSPRLALVWDQVARSEIVPQPPTPTTPLDAAWLADSSYNQRYDTSAEAQVRVRAVVEAVETFVPAAGAEPGLALRVSAAGRETLVHVGPLRYLRDQGVRFNYRDEITILGVRSTFNNASILIAAEIISGTTTTRLRELETGSPLWDGHQAD